MNQKDTSRRQEILAAAQSCFVEKGYAGASLRYIADAANIPQGLIYHYFKNKEKLWVEVKLNILQKYFNDDILKSAPTENLHVFLEYVVNKRFEFYENNPDIVRMIYWQFLEKQEEVLQVTPEKQYNKLKGWIDSIIILQQKMEISSKFEASLILSMILKTTAAPFLSSALPFKTPIEKKKYLELLLQLLFEGLKYQGS